MHTPARLNLPAITAHQNTGCFTADRAFTLPASNPRHVWVSSIGGVSAATSWSNREQASYEWIDERMSECLMTFLQRTCRSGSAEDTDWVLDADSSGIWSCKTEHKQESGGK